MNIDSDEFANRCNEHRRDLLYYAFTCSRDLALAEDIVQEALVIAVNKREHYFPEADLKAWLIALVRNMWFKERERSQRKQRHIKFIEENAALLFDGQETQTPPEAEHAVLENCLQKLEESDRSIIQEHFVNNLKYTEIAERMRKNLSWVKVRMFRARLALLQCVEFNLQKKSLLNES
jgi:RNA polymerase sigma-70 factor, ECF subfamily